MFTSIIIITIIIIIIIIIIIGLIIIASQAECRLNGAMSHGQGQHSA